jgi:hypothetical protein
VFGWTADSAVVPAAAMHSARSRAVRGMRRFPFERFEMSMTIRLGDGAKSTVADLKRAGCAGVEEIAGNDLSAAAR